MSEITNEKANEMQKEGIGAYVGNVILAMLFPIVALWYGPKYLFKGEYVKGIVLILIVGVELFVVLSLQNAL